eukprot:2422789-Prymnesium_polylepis.1
MVVVAPDKRQNKRLAVSEPDAFDSFVASKATKEYDGIYAHLHEQHGEGKEEEEEEDAYRSGGNANLEANVACGRTQQGVDQRSHHTPLAE